MHFKSFNINDYIKVKLTVYGYKVHITHYKKYLGENYNKKLFAPVVDNEGYTRYQLWEFMNIFGEYMFNGAEQVIQYNLIYFEKEDSMVEPIKVGEEVMLRGIKDYPIGVVTLNTADHFCVITKDGFTFNTSRASANPIKTGKRYDVERFLRSMQV